MRRLFSSLPGEEIGGGLCRNSSRLTELERTAFRDHNNDNMRQRYVIIGFYAELDRQESE